jgi:hypothetical protein
VLDGKGFRPHATMSATSTGVARNDVSRHAALLATTLLSPPTSEGPVSTDVTGTQGPARWRRGARLPGPRRLVAREGPARRRPDERLLPVRAVAINASAERQRRCLRAGETNHWVARERPSGPRTIGARRQPGIRHDGRVRRGGRTLSHDEPAIRARLALSQAPATAPRVAGTAPKATTSATAAIWPLTPRASPGVPIIAAPTFTKPAKAPAESAIETPSRILPRGETHAETKAAGAGDSQRSCFAPGTTCVAANSSAATYAPTRTAIPQSHARNMPFCLDMATSG